MPASRRLARFLPERKLPPNIKIYFGWAWWTLTSEDVDAVIEFIKERTDVVKFYHHVHIADESFFQTALVNAKSHPPLICNPRRYIIFPNGSLHPKILSFEDLEHTLASDAIFARKFDEGSSPGIIEAVEKKRGCYPAF